MLAVFVRLSSNNFFRSTQVTTTTLRKSLSEEKLNQIATLQRIWTNIRAARLRIRKQSDTIRNFYNTVSYPTYRFLFTRCKRPHAGEEQ